MILPLLNILVLTSLFGNSLEESLSASECFWTSCLERKPSSIAATVCGAKSQSVIVKQSCHTATTAPEKGFKVFCCSLLRKSKSVKRKCSPAGDSKKNVMWWPDDNGKVVEILLNCPFAPPVEKFMKNELVQFLLYTKNTTNPFAFKKLFVGDTNQLKKSGFIKNAPIKMIIHGFNIPTALFSGPAPELHDYYLRLNTSLNVIVVDWSLLSSITNLLIPCYDLIAQLSRFVGLRSALLLKFLLEQKVARLKDIHVIGHSLGAHASGFTGKRFFEFTNHKIPRITGMDPAGPSFMRKNASERIDRSDADFVDIIHTAISDFDFVPVIGSSINLGLNEVVGHVDFFPNKGSKQAGCKFNPIDPASIFCGHNRAITYYAESIKPPSGTVFRGLRCNNMKEAVTGNCRGPETTLMGACTNLNTSSSSQSLIYYLKTSDKSPYALDKRKNSDYKYCPNP